MFNHPPFRIAQIGLVSPCRAAMLIAGDRGPHDNLQADCNSLESSKPRPLNLSEQPLREPIATRPSNSLKV